MQHNEVESSMNFTDKVGKRLFIKEAECMPDIPTEVRVVEVTPSGDFVKLEDLLYRTIKWFSSDLILEKM